MQNVFSVRKKGLSEETAQRLSTLGFNECEEGYFIDLQRLDTKYRLRKQHNKVTYSKTDIKALKAVAKKKNLEIDKRLENLKMNFETLLASTKDK